MIFLSENQKQNNKKMNFALKKFLSKIWVKEIIFSISNKLYGKIDIYLNENHWSQELFVFFLF